MGFSRQEYWSVLPCPPPGNLLDPVVEPKSLMSPALAGRFLTTSVILLGSPYYILLFIYFITGSQCLLISFIYFTKPPNILPYGNNQFVLCIYVCFCFLTVCIILFIFGCAGSLLLRGLASSCSEQELLSSFGAQASHWNIFSFVVVVVVSIRG